MQPGAHEGQSLLPDLALSDVHLARGDGCTMLRMMRAISRLESVPVAMVSSSKNPADIQRSLECGASHRLPKPVSLRESDHEIAAILETWLSPPHAGPGQTSR